MRRSVLCVAVLALALGCGREAPDRTPSAGSPPSSSKVVLIGWDGASWEVIDELLARGELPALGGLVRRGSRAVLRAEPPILSPVVWTTIATGFRPGEHGVTGFELPDPAGGEGRVLAASFHRRRAPLWQMVSAGERTVGVVGWWTSWPAEAVRGYLVSDHLAYNRWDAWAHRGGGFDERARLTFPEGLADELAPVAVRPERVGLDTLLAIAPFDEVEQREALAATAPVKFHAPSVLRYGYVTDASNQAFALRMLETRGQTDLFSITYILTDVAGHVFWHHYRPELFPPGDGRNGRLRDAVPNVYRLLDRWTGEILSRIDPSSTVIVLSDHGMGAGRSLPVPGKNPGGDHSPDGIFVAAGPGVPAGADLGVLAQVDVVPTVLATLGLPVARDMPGRVVELLLPPGAGERRFIASYGEGLRAAPPGEASPGEEDYLARLKSLGYVK